MPSNDDEMMDLFDRGILRVLIGLILGLILAAVILAIDCWLEPAALAPRLVFTEAQREWVAERMRYHGITTSIFDGREYYFYRDGKKCRL